jgi:hypothetical protein
MGMKLALSREREANNRHALISVSVKPSYSAKISAVVASWASRFKIYSTVKRVPQVMIGKPVIT